MDIKTFCGLIYMVLKSRDYVIKMSIFMKLSIQCITLMVHVYVHIKRLISLRAALAANRSI